MKRAAFFLLLVGVPLVLLVFPELRRRLAGKLRFILLVYAGALLLVGASTLMTSAATPPLLALLGLGVLLAAFLAVLLGK